MPATATRVSTQERISVPSETVPRRVQPAGVVSVAARAVETKSSSRSPACTDAGTNTIGFLVLESDEAPARHCGPTGGGGSSSATTSCVTTSVAPSSSVTVRVTV